MCDTTDSTEQVESAPDADGRCQLVNDGGDATLLLHEGTELESTLGNDGTLSDPENSVNPVIKRVMQWVKASISLFANHWTQISDNKKKTMCNAIDGKIGHIGKEIDMISRKEGDTVRRRCWWHYSQFECSHGREGRSGETRFVARRGSHFS